MSPSTPSLRVHRIVEYIKEYGFWLETDEVEELGALAVLHKHFGIRMVLSQEVRWTPKTGQVAKREFRSRID